MNQSCYRLLASVLFALLSLSEDRVVGLKFQVTLTASDRCQGRSSIHPEAALPNFAAQSSS